MRENSVLHFDNKYKVLSNLLWSFVYSSLNISVLVRKVKHIYKKNFKINHYVMSLSENIINIFTVDINVLIHTNNPSLKQCCLYFYNIINNRQFIIVLDQ
jgi:hypothetical protein